MAITRAQQVRQMLEDGGMLVSPSTTGKRPGYRGRGAKDPREVGFDAREAAASRRGSGVGSTYDSPAQSFTDSVPSSSYDAPTGAVDDPFRGGGQSPDYNYVVTNRTGYDEETGINTPPRNTIIGGDGGLETIPTANLSKKKSRGGLKNLFRLILGGLTGIPFNFLSGGSNIGSNVLGKVKSFNQRLRDTDFARSKTLVDYFNTLKNKNKVDTTGLSGINPTFQDDIGNELLLSTEASPNIIIPKKKPDTQGLLEVPEIELTPFQKDIKQDDFEEGLPKDVLDNLMADALTTPTAGQYGLSLRQLNVLKNAGYSNKQIEEASEKGYADELVRDIEGPITLADGGMIGGGIMDAAGRQQYFLGKLVKKATRAVKKIVKSPVGRLGLGALAFKLGGGFAADGFLRKKLLPKLISGGKLTGLGQLGLGAAISAAPLLFQEEEEEQPTGFTGSVGGEIDPRAYTDPYGVLFRAFRAEGGSMKEPVAKKTMPLLDMGGQEMDLRAEGGFVPIGRMEKADDVPARLSKNEFVFTADAVRNAGDGDVDKGAEVMYNMMKNLEAGGDVSEESQGLEGARNMFQTAKRLEDVV